MVENLTVIYPCDHQGHHPQTFFNFGEMQDNLEKPARIEVIRSALSELPVVHVDECRRHATPEELCTVHSHELVHFLTTTMAEWDADWPAEVVSGLFPYSFSDARIPKWPLAQAAYFSFDAGTPIGPETSRAATAAAGCALEGAEAIRSGAHTLVYALCRPPGHHATTSRYGGFCFFNNAALAAGLLTSLGRVAILDIDFHHGNGTQEITYRSDQVMYVSIHGDPNYAFPYFYGYASERGEGDGEGYTLNLPLDPGATLGDYQPALERAVQAIADADCQALVLSVGFDTCKGDPFGVFALQPDDYQPLGSVIGSLSLPTCIVQEGGYQVDRIGLCAQALVAGLLS